MNPKNRLADFLIAENKPSPQPLSDPTDVIASLLGKPTGAGLLETLAPTVNYHTHITNVTINKVYVTEDTYKSGLAKTVPFLGGEAKEPEEQSDEELLSTIEWHIRKLNGEIQALRTKLAEGFKRMDAMEAKNHGTC